MNTRNNCTSYEALKKLYDRPLTKDEADFSAEHLPLVFWYLRQRELDEQDWFDIVIFRYLLSVKRWFECPELHRYEFSTIAVAAMRSAINAERVKQARRIATISLETPVGRTGLTLGDCIAA